MRQRGTNLPAPVSVKKVLKESSSMAAPSGCWPSGWMPCSAGRARGGGGGAEEAGRRGG